MAKVKIDENKIKAIAIAIRTSNFFIAGTGCFDLPGNEYVEFLKAIMSNSPTKELEKLYERLRL